MNAMTSGQSQAHAAIRKLRSSLKAWLKVRCRNDELAVGKVRGKLPPQIVAQSLSEQRDWDTEQALANHLHALLLECGWDAQKLPHPSLKRDRAAAVKLARISLAGALPGEAGESGLGLWPIAIVAGAAVLTISSITSNLADVAKEKERIQCVQNGGGLACQDMGFFVKVAGGVALGWYVWAHLGLREKVKSKIGGA